jgi:hypothetical protein
VSAGGAVAELERLEAPDGQPPEGAPLATGRPLLSRGPLRRRRWWGTDEADVLVQPGDRVDAGDAVARLRRPARATALDAAAILGVPPERVEGILTRRAGEMVAEGDVLAERRALAGLQRRVLRAPVSGHLSYVSPAYGTVYIEPPPAEGPILAHLSGTVAAVEPDGVLLEGYGCAVAGVAGAGPAAAGPLLLAESPTSLPAQASGSVVACAFPLLEATVRSLADSGAAAVLAPGIADATLERLGWDDLLWTAPVRLDRGERGAPRPAPPLTCVLLSVAAREAPPDLWDALGHLAGRLTSAVGGEPGGVPELLVALDPPGGDATAVQAAGGAGIPLAPGTPVRILAGRAEGLAGEVVLAEDAPYRLASEVAAAVADVRLPDGARLRVPLVHLQPIGRAS